MQTETITRKSQIDLWISKVCRNDKNDPREDLADKATVLSNVMFLRKFPFETYGIRLHKVRARMMVEAIQLDSITRGNLDIHLNGNCYIFSYRGTAILKWDFGVMEGDGISKMNAGIYEETPSTMNQRKVARQAIEEFQNAVFHL